MENKELITQVILGIIENPLETLTLLLLAGEEGQQILEAVVEAAQQGDEEAAQAVAVIQKLVLDANSLLELQITSARKGAKLKYLKHLSNLCPEGYELTLFKAGGKVCKKCLKMKEAACGTKLKAEEGAKVTGTKEVKAFKCGRKMRKAAEGSKLDLAYAEYAPFYSDAINTAENNLFAEGYKLALYDRYLKDRLKRVLAQRIADLAELSNDQIVW